MSKKNAEAQVIETTAEATQTAETAQATETTVAKVNDAAALATPLNRGELVYTSIVATDKATKKKLFNALNGDTQKLSDYIGKTVKIVDVVVETAAFVNEETGEIEDTYKVTLLDVSGVAYSAFSKGMYYSVKNIIGAFGTPDTWDEPMECEVKQVTSGKFKSLKLFVV